MGLFILIFRSLSRDLRVGGRRGALATLRYLFLSFSLSLSLYLSFSRYLFLCSPVRFSASSFPRISNRARGLSGRTGWQWVVVDEPSRPRCHGFNPTVRAFLSIPVNPSRFRCVYLWTVLDSCPFFSSFCDILRCFSHGSKSSTIKRYPPSLPSAPARRFRGTKNRIAFELEKISGSFFTKKLDFELTSSRRKKAGSSSLFNLATATDFRLSKLFSFSLRYV